MCTGNIDIGQVEGSAKGAAGWFTVSQAQVYYDHPYHAPFAEALMIDFVDPQKGPAARVAVELTKESALELMRLIQLALEHGENHHAAVPAAVLEPAGAR
ncbi:MAG: DUF6295 family protein [Chloroflexi bacterium]|nr:DUF6295 family protein [Chloroflexota bacterium]